MKPAASPEKRAAPASAPGKRKCGALENWHADFAECGRFQPTGMDRFGCFAHGVRLHESSSLTKLSNAAWFTKSSSSSMHSLCRFWAESHPHQANIPNAATVPVRRRGSAACIDSAASASPLSRSTSYRHSSIMMKICPSPAAPADLHADGTRHAGRGFRQFA